MKKIHDIRLYIRQYLNGELSEEESNDFVAQVESDEELETMLAEETMRHAERWELKQRLQKIKEQHSRNAEEHTGWWTVGRIAASIALLVVLTVSILVIWPTSGDTQLAYQEYFEPYRGTSIPRGGNVELEGAMKVYHETNYSEALKKLNASTEKIYLHHFYAAMCYMAMEEPNFDKALIELEQVLTSNNDYKQQAKWYIALCYLGKNDVEEAKKRLKVIALIKGEYKHVESQALLDRLD